MESLFKKVQKIIVSSKERILSGLNNSIPWGFPKLERILPGIEREKFYCITANTSVGKSKLAKYMFLIAPFEFHRKTGEPINIIYYSLEESKEYLMMNVVAYYLYHLYGMRKEPKDLLSLQSPLDDLVINKINQMEDLLKLFEQKVMIIDELREPTEIFHHALHHIKKEVDCFNIIILDHLSLLDPEKGCPTVRDSMIRFTSKYGIILRNKHKCTICAVQQQAADQESFDRLKENKLEPSLNGLADAKVCGRDYNIVFGLFAPIRHELGMYRGFNIKELEDSYRALFVLKNREGPANIVDHLLFDGAVNDFREMEAPKPKYVL